MCSQNQTVWLFDQINGLAQDSSNACALAMVFMQSWNVVFLPFIQLESNFVRTWIFVFPLRNREQTMDIFCVGKVNICNFSCAQATTFIFNSRNNVLGQVLSLWTELCLSIIYIVTNRNRNLPLSKLYSSFLFIYETTRIHAYSYSRLAL